MAFILRLLRDGLIVKPPVEGRIHDGENVAFLDVLAFGVGNIDEPAADLGAHGCGIEGLNRADAVQINGYIGGLHLLRQPPGRSGLPHGDCRRRLRRLSRAAALTACSGICGFYRICLRKDLVFVDESNQPGGKQYKNQIGR